MKDESIKCIAEYQGYRIYYDGKHNEYFVLTNSLKITRYPKRISENIGKWYEKMVIKHKETVQ